MNLDQLNDFSNDLRKYFRDLEKKLYDIIGELDDANEQTALAICEKVSKHLDEIYQDI